MDSLGKLRKGVVPQLLCIVSDKEHFLDNFWWKLVSELCVDRLVPWNSRSTSASLSIIFFNIFSTNFLSCPLTFLFFKIKTRTGFLRNADCGLRTEHVDGGPSWSALDPRLSLSAKWNKISWKSQQFQTNDKTMGWSQL